MMQTAVANQILHPNAVADLMPMRGGVPAAQLPIVPWAAPRLAALFSRAQEFQRSSGCLKIAAGKA
jgi:hypothetical protein